MTRSRLSKVAPLLFGSGLCALIYQTVWLREFRLIFGASTAASAAVLAIFMAGLGLGSALLGGRADRQTKPLGFYANLELLIAASAAVSPFLVALVRSAYLGLGGTVSLGMFFGTSARLLLSALVLAAPTILMGGTLPAAARAVQSDDDPHRRNLAILYGVNTLGAVTGAVLSTFFLLEVFGNRNTLWLACLLNALVAIVARSTSRSMEATPTASREPVPTTPDAPAAAPSTVGSLPPQPFVLLAAAITGFTFLLMELVWYRMLGPILGGTTFTFGLILAMALFGIGLGGAAYAFGFRFRQPTLTGFALSCAAEAAFIALPFALGDRLAVTAALLRPLGNVGFSGMVLGWVLIATVVVLPAAFISGVQFPLLLALMGRGGQNVGKQVGQIYVWNTAGSITGSLAGGFGVLPLLTAPGTWQLVAGLLATLGLASAVVSLRSERRYGAVLGPVLVAGLAFLLLTAEGPTSAWRHGGVGAGRSGLEISNLNQIEAWRQYHKSIITWETEGVESSVGLSATSGLAFIVNGKSDGNTIGDAPTQVMSGLLGTLLHPNPRNGLVIGLGTGSTAGWIGQVPQVERVDVVEIEPAILEVARRSASVNANVLDNPKVHVFSGDAREVLLASKQTYDIIFSEPSNPYRAGIASLFTRDFYQAVKGRLAEGGIFIQWLQAYEVDAMTIHSAYATLASEFEYVETWQSHSVDLLLVATRKPLVHDIARIRSRLTEVPYQSALRDVWRTDEAEGVLARFVANPGLTAQAAEAGADFVNTDDLSFIEFAFPRSLGRTTGFSVEALWASSRTLGTDHPLNVEGAVDWDRVEQLRAWNGFAPNAKPPRPSPAFVERQTFIDTWRRGAVPAALARWREKPWEPRGPKETMTLAFGLADLGDEAALPLITAVRPTLPVEADLCEGMLRLRQKRAADAAQLFERAFVTMRKHPWSPLDFTRSVLKQLPLIARADKALGRKLFDLLAQPFAAEALTQPRQDARMDLALALDWKGLCVELLAAQEPHVSWDGRTLTLRRRCYQENGHPLAATAEADLARFIDLSAAVLLPQVSNGSTPAPASAPATPQDQADASLQ
ncbi:fused MFS/spermidine synthase [Myxococcus sp. K15C18031901]|uniref:fused MFS/spermidine synthase n=1 Tax=Myxococcus dinghuensis TaxID=2906761 RepID=UPI0020A718D6|nr:fused MFS/spermidine synthase [Myxococcus dinghuensis]MCP3100335.1 fused MFS/spermidine synthase [Myxococcus dinghuensis]